MKQNNSYQPAGTGFGPALLSNGLPATFQAGFPGASPAVIPSNGIITNPDPNQQYEYIPLDFKNPYVESWNVAIQQALPAHFTLDVAYVGNHGVDTVASTNINAATVVGLGTKGQPEFPRTASTIQYWQGFSSMYNALQAKFDRRFTSGMLVTTAFTWGKGMSYQQSDDGGLQYYINLRRNYARTDFDRTLTFNQNFVYDLPFGQGKHWAQSGVAAAVAGGWRISTGWALMTGTPVNISYSGSNLLAPGNGQSPDQIAAVQITHTINDSPWFSTASFQPPSGTNFGNVGRNSLSGPGLFGMNGALSKAIRINERWRAELRGEAFNFTNTPQFSNPNGSLGNAKFGFVTSTVGSGSGVNGTGGQRAVQVAMKVTF